LKKSYNSSMPTYKFRVIITAFINESEGRMAERQSLLTKRDL